MTKRKWLDTVRSRLWQEYSNHRARHRELTDFFAPYRGRFTITDANRGVRKNQRIVNTHALDAVSTIKSGMMAGITNPSTEWVRLTVADKRSAEEGETKEWLTTVTKDMNSVFLKSNLYKTLPNVYGDMAVVANGALLMEEDWDDIVRFSSLPIGSYRISCNKKGKVDTVEREFRMTVRQLIETFAFEEGEPLVEDDIDWDLFSTKVHSFWKDGGEETWIDVVHIVLPNPEYDPNKLESKFKRYASYYYERGTTGANGGSTTTVLDSEKFLSESGFDLFPIAVPRWEVTGEDAYGTNCPAINAEGQQRALQTAERRLAQADELGINPPLNIPADLKKKNTSSLPGARVYTDGETAQRAITSLFEVNFDKNSMENRILRHQEAIDRLFFKKAFVAISDLDRANITATEINARLQEGRLMIAGALINIQDDLLEPLVDFAFAKMDERDLIPDAPDDIQGQSLKVEFIGVLAQAQKSIALNGLVAFYESVGNVAALTDDPTVWDKVNTEQLIDELAESGGVTPAIIVPDDDVELIKQQRMEAEQAMQQQEQMAQMASSAKDLSQTDLSGDNALSALAENAGV